MSTIDLFAPTMSCLTRAQSAFLTSNIICLDAANVFWKPAPGTQPGTNRRTGKISTRYLPGVNASAITSITCSNRDTYRSSLCSILNPYEILIIFAINELTPMLY